MTQQLIDSYSNKIESTFGNSPELGTFKKGIIPNTKVEDWKYTQLSKWLPENISLNEKSNSFDFELAEDYIFGTYKVFIVDGVLDQENINLPKELSLNQSNTIDFPEIESWKGLNSLSKLTTKKLISLDIRKNVSIDSPISIIHINTKTNDAIISSQVEITIGAFSKAQIIESFISLPNAKFTEFSQTIITTEESSNLLHLKFQNNNSESIHLAQTDATCKKASVINSFTLILGSKLSRNNIIMNMNEEESTCHVNGLYSLYDDQHCDNYSEIRHHVSRTYSHQLFKSLLNDSSRGVFTGRVFIARDAIEVDSNQLNKNLLLSKKAHAHTRPQLEVYADDVKAAHGATVGQMSDDELFYLEARGIPESKARQILCHGFAKDALDTIDDVELVKKIVSIMDKRNLQ